VREDQHRAARAIIGAGGGAVLGQLEPAFGDIVDDRIGHRLQNLSIALATASPPPMQRLATPRFSPRASSADRSVAMTRAPEAPIGWPSAQAPPLTFSFSCGIASS